MIYNDVYMIYVNVYVFEFMKFMMFAFCLHACLYISIYDAFL